MGVAPLMRPCLARSPCIRRPALCPLWNRSRPWHRRDSADSRRAWRKRRSRYEDHITLGRCRSACHTPTRKGIPVGVRCCETVRERLHEGHNQILLVIRQVEIADRHVDIVRDLWHGPAVHFFCRSLGAVSRRDVVRIHVARIIEMDELLQALRVAVVKELLLEVRYRLPFWSFWPASVMGHCSGAIATSRTVDVCIWPSTVGADFSHCEFGLDADP
jgi:hypothetical protein